MPRISRDRSSGDNKSAASLDAPETHQPTSKRQMRNLPGDPPSLEDHFDESVNDPTLEHSTVAIFFQKHKKVISLVLSFWGIWWIGYHQTFVPRSHQVADKPLENATKKEKQPFCNPQKPHVLFILLDQLRFDAIRCVQDRLPHYNENETTVKIETPNIDRLFYGDESNPSTQSRSSGTRKGGTLFENAYCVSPVCVPSRTAIKSGTTLQRSGVSHNDLRDENVYGLMDFIREKVRNTQTFEQALARFHGYRVETYGKWHAPLVFYNMDSNSNENKSAIRYDYYDFDKNAFGLELAQKFDPIYKRYAPAFLRQNHVDTSMRGNYTQISLITGYPYQEIPREGWNESTLKQRGCRIVGQDLLESPYTYTGLIGEMALRALDRLTQQEDPFLLSAHFLAPHPPTIATKKHLRKYFDNRHNILAPKSKFRKQYFKAYYPKNREKLCDDRSIVAEIAAAYYAMVSEVDEWVGKLVGKVDSSGLTNCTMVIFTSDHGEMLGAHGLLGKLNFFEEAVRVPLIVSFPGKIPERHIVSQSVSQIDIAATIFDYTNAIHLDNTDGKSLRGRIEQTSYNALFDEDTVVSELDHRAPINATAFTGPPGMEPEFMVRNKEYKLVIPRLHNSTVPDMLFNVAVDPFEQQNLLTKKSNSTIGKAEHLKVLLIEWMKRNDGSGQFYSRNRCKLDVGEGDIEEVRRRRTWRDVEFWLSEGKVLSFGAPSYKPELDLYQRNEYLYMGRTLAGVTNVTEISVVGPSAGLFTLSQKHAILNEGEHVRIKVEYKSSKSAAATPVDARIVIKIDGTTNPTFLRIELRDLVENGVGSARQRKNVAVNT